MLNLGVESISQTVPKAATIKPDYRFSLCIFLPSGNDTLNHYGRPIRFHQIVTLKFRETHRRSAAVAWQCHPYDLEDATFWSHDLLGAMTPPNGAASD